MRRKTFAWLLIAALTGFLAACGDSEDPKPQGTGGTPGTGGAPGDGGTGGGDGGSGGAGGSEPSALQITDVMPGIGNAVGSDTIVIKGSGFFGNDRDERRRTEVWFGEGRSLDVRVIDDSTIYASTPASVPGIVDVTVRNPSGEATCQGCFRYIPSLRIDSIEPTEGPLVGGSSFVLHGIGLAPEMVVTIGNRAAIGLEIDENGSLHGIVPPGDAEGPVDVRIFSDEGDASLRRAFTYVDRLRIEEIVPPGGPLAGGNTVTIRGTGFGNSPTVRLGGVEVAAVRNLDGSLEFVAPPSTTPGRAELTVQSSVGSVTAAYGYYDPQTAGEVDLYAVTPNLGPTTGGNWVAIVGSGFEPSTLAVWFDEVLAEDIEVEGAHFARVKVPAVDSAGPVTVRVRVHAGEALLPNAYRFYQPIEIDSVEPSSGPSDGGTKIEIVGKNFPVGAKVYVGALEADKVNRRSATLISAETPRGSAGPVAVRVVDPEDPDGYGIKEGAFFYQTSLRLAVLEPNTGSRAGGTRVTIRGSGFTPQTHFAFGETPAENIEIINPYTAIVHTPPGQTGLVDVSAETPDEEIATLRHAFTYFDPGTSSGGSSGGPLNGTLHVTVLSDSDENRGEPIEGCTVWAGNDVDSMISGTTDARGQTTLASPTLVKSVNVHAECEKYSSASVLNQRSENLTILVQINQSDEDGEDGEMPFWPPGIISGQVFGFKLPPNRQLQPGEVEIAYVSVGYPHVYASPPYFGSPPPEIPVEQEGGRFSFSFLQAARVTLYATYGIWDTTTGIFHPMLMGIKRGVSIAPEEEVLDANIVLSIRLDKEVPVTIANPPGNLVGRTEVEAFIDLGADGIISVGKAVNSPNATQVVLRNLPNLTGESFLFRAVGHPAGESSNFITASFAFRKQSGDLSSGVTIGPMLGASRMVQPSSPMSTLSNVIEWNLDPGPEPEFFYISLGVPVPGDVIPLWDIVVPGTERKVVIPPAAFNKLKVLMGGEPVLFEIRAAQEPRFSYDTWTYDNIRNFFEYTSFSLHMMYTVVPR